LDKNTPITTTPITTDADEPTPKETNSRSAASTNVPNAPDRGRSPSLAALLSFIWPGLGQLYAGKRRLAAIFAVPALLLLLVMVWELRQGLLVFAVRFADPAFSGPAAVLVLLLGAWRLAAVGHAYLSGERHKSRRVLDRLVVAALVAVIVVSHAGAGYMLAVAYDTGNKVFGPNPSDQLDFTTSQPTTSAGQSAGSSLIAGATPTIPGTPGSTVTPSADGRVTMIFTGQDAAPESGEPNRNAKHYDSIMVVSYDPQSNSIQMVSIPREFAGFPMWYGGTDCFNKQSCEITYLAEMVDSGSVQSPYKAGYTTLVEEVQYLVGIPIDYHTTMNLDEFEKVIDAIGGVDIVNPAPISTPNFDMLNGTKGFYLAAGPQHLNGLQAMAYARDRYAPYKELSGDYARLGREQQIMTALLKKFSGTNGILNLTMNFSNLMAAVGSSIHTNFPADQLPDFVARGETVLSSGTTTNVVLGPPYVTNIPNNVAKCPVMSKIAAESIALFGQDSLWYGKPVPASVCS